MSDFCYNEEDILVVIEYFRVEGGKKFSVYIFDVVCYFYGQDWIGDWSFELMFVGREVLLLGIGFGVKCYKWVLENYIWS